MASAYGIARTYNEFIPPVDLKLLGQAMEVKQQKFDTNFTNIQNTIDLLGNVDLIKDADRQYFGERVKGLIEDVNTFGDINLSSNAVSSQIQSHIKQALDENVMNGMEGTAKYRKYMAEVEDYKKNKPEKFNEINRMYGLLPFTQWKNDGQAGTTYGAIEYTPFVDIEKKQNDFMAEIVKSKGIGKIDYLDGRGNKVTVSTWGLSDEEIRRIAESRFDQQDDKQLEINGWYHLAGANTEQAQGLVKGHYEEQKTFLDHEIAERESKLKDIPKGGVRDRLAEEVYMYKSRLKNLEDVTDSLKGQSAAVIGKYMAKEKIIGDMVNIYKEDERSREYGKDDVFFENIKVNQEWQKINISGKQLELAGKEYQLKKDKADEDKEEKRKAQLLSTYNIDLPVSTAVVKIDDIVKKVDSSNSLLTNQLNEIVSKLPEATQKMLVNATNEEKLNVLSNSSQPEIASYKAQLAEYAYTLQQNNEVKEGMHSANRDIIRAKALELGKQSGNEGTAYYEPLIKGYKNLYLNNHDTSEAIKYKGLMVSAMIEAKVPKEKITKYLQEVEIAYNNSNRTAYNSASKKFRGNEKTGLNSRNSSSTNYEEDTPEWVKNTLKFTDAEKLNYEGKLLSLQKNINVNQAIVVTPSNTALGSIRAVANGNLVAYGNNKVHPIEEGQNITVYKDTTPGTDQYIILAGVKETGEGFKGSDTSGGDRTVISKAVVSAHDIEPFLKQGGISIGNKLDAPDFTKVKFKGGKMLDHTNSKDIGTINYLANTVGADLTYMSMPLNKTGGEFENKNYFVTSDGGLEPIKDIYTDVDNMDFKPQTESNLRGDKVIDVYKRGVKLGTASFSGDEWTADLYKSLYLAKGIIVNKMLLQGVTK